MQNSNFEILLELVEFENSVMLPVTNKNNYNIIQYDVYNKRKNWKFLNVADFGTIFFISIFNFFFNFLATSGISFSHSKKSNLCESAISIR